MGEYIRITYRGDENPIDVLKEAIKRHGRDKDFMLVPASLCRWIEKQTKGKKR